jgi:hypothetical protein
VSKPTFQVPQLPETYPAVPISDPIIENQAPLLLLERIADQHAYKVWGNEIARGEPFPVSDVQGKLLAYVFPFIRGSRRFPGYKAIFNSVRNARLQDLESENGKDDFPHHIGPNLSGVESGFGSIYVSASRRDTQILRVEHFLHRYFLVGERAQGEAQRRFGSTEVQLTRVYSFNPCEEYVEFSRNGKRILINTHSLEAEDSKEVLAPKVTSVSAKLRKIIEENWNALELSGPLGIAPEETSLTHSVKYLANLALVPILLWTLNCATTAKAMVLGYWDNLVSGTGKILGFGRLIDYWYEHPSNGENVPNLIDEVHAANKIDFWKVNNYTCQWDEIKSSSNNGWAWKDFTGEIDNGRPACWSFLHQKKYPHTMAGIGYRVEPYGKWAIVYNTWDKNLSEYPYSDCTGVARIIPKGGSNGDDSAIFSPKGGEYFESSVPAEIYWHIWGSKINKTTLLYSEDGGKNWVTLASDIPTQAGFNSYFWLPGKTTSKGRVRLQANFGNDYIAGDGSFGNFSIQPQVGGGTWRKINESVGIVLAGYHKQTGARVIYATDLATGDIYQFGGKPNAYFNWIKVGGPGKSFVLDAQGRLYGLSADRAGVYLYGEKPMQWKQIGGPAKEIFGDLYGVCATNPDTGDINRYFGVPFSWLRIGGPGKTFACDSKCRIYGLSSDGSGVWRYDGLFGPPIKWVKVGGPAANLYGRGLGIYATNPQNGDINFFNGKSNCWTRVGGPGNAFSVDFDGRLYGLSTDGKSVWRHDGSLDDSTKWTQIGGPTEAISAGWKEVLAINSQKELWIYSP